MNFVVGKSLIFRKSDKFRGHFLENEVFDLLFIVNNFSYTRLHVNHAVRSIFIGHITYDND